jgi:hypothetical protein
MRLVIEHIGGGPNSLPAISVAHYYEVNGDLCQDPEMCFEIESTPDGLVFHPYMFQMAIPPVYQEVTNDAQGFALAEQLRQFATMWDANLRSQGFIEAALRSRVEGEVRSSYWMCLHCRQKNWLCSLPMQSGRSTRRL